MNRRVLVTGMAWDTALGTSLDEVWARLLAGETGLREVPSAYGLRNRTAAPLADPPPDWAPARRQVALATRTVDRAIRDAGLGGEPGSALLVLGTSYGAQLDDPRAGGLHDWATAVAAELGFTRPPVSVSTACSSGADAIMVGGHLIAAGVADVCVCGGVDVLTEAKRLGHSALGTMSPTTLRAFDADGDGTLLGEGAGVVVLEEADRAHRRGVGGYATLLGGGSSNDAAGMTAPDPSGAAVLLAVRRSLAEAGLRPDQIAVINAHGSGTPVNDAVEAASFARLFPDGTRPVLFATKGAFGHTLGATGAIEAIALVQALRHGKVPPVYGLETVAAAVTLPMPRGGPVALGDGAGLSVTLGFGGFNTSLVLAGVPDGLG
ncbi:beta-ketoacyl-[acyl-carrier-protein] synthase family protein [Micromonospora sp. KC213]|uniref:beta-ketoacyl-[acyl-carrier-protein] synthase family protein n=1 Tax=Micromonospora sp. KC213 TaxID=2530378 RepID=UPI00104D0AF0|nr:beta-ketoacyl-[acyl-carrier-protein] synthase family protein [Micromonospora sp. KC213]TDC42940.1 beta-ketoacyl-[acyl-carrier-protein] synthase family protein [Micromonospora sp. KC213]